MFGKQTWVNFKKKAKNKTKDKLDHIYSNLWGLNKISSRSGDRYFVTLIDGYTRMVWVYFLKTIDEEFPTFVKLKIMIERQNKSKVK